MTPCGSTIKYMITLRSKHTGETIYLGSSFATREEAQAYIDRDVCLRCNYADINPLTAEQLWLGRTKGWHYLTGEKLMEAEGHFNDRKEFWIWVKRNFGINAKQARHYINLVKVLDSPPTGEAFVSLKDIARKKTRKPVTLAKLWTKAKP